MGGHGHVAPFSDAAVANAFHQLLCRIALTGIFGGDIFESGSDQFDRDRVASEAIVFCAKASLATLWQVTNEAAANTSTFSAEGNALCLRNRSMAISAPTFLAVPARRFRSNTHPDP